MLKSGQAKFFDSELNYEYIHILKDSNREIFLKL